MLSFYFPFIRKYNFSKGRWKGKERSRRRGLNFVIKLG
jgi:hypothetical protein